MNVSALLLGLFAVLPIGPQFAASRVHGTDEAPRCATWLFWASSLEEEYREVHIDVDSCGGEISNLHGEGTMLHTFTCQDPRTASALCCSTPHRVACPPTGAIWWFGYGYANGAGSDADTGQLPCHDGEVEN